MALLLALIGAALLLAGPAVTWKTKLADQEATPGESLGHRWISTWRGPIRLTLPQYVEALDRGRNNVPPRMVVLARLLTGVGVVCVIVAALM